MSCLLRFLIFKFVLIYLLLVLKIKAFFERKNRPKSAEVFFIYCIYNPQLSWRPNQNQVSS